MVEAAKKALVEQLWLVVRKREEKMRTMTWRKIPYKIRLES